MQQISFIDYLKSYPLYLLPKHLLSALLHRFMRIKNPAVKDAQIELFCKLFSVNLAEAEKSRAEDYKDFNQFFTRSLKPEAREQTIMDDAILSPVDGQLSEAGIINNETLIQAKGQDYTLTELLGGRADLNNIFRQGTFLTIYLSPRDYHRIHMPVKGRLEQMIHIPGELFSVNSASVKTVPRLFARNERVVNIFDTAIGKMALIQVGAIFVSSIETSWHGVVTPPRKKFIQHWDYSSEQIELNQLEEMGRFNMGSTVILLFAKDQIQLSEQLNSMPLVNGTNIQLGNKLASINS